MLLTNAMIGSSRPAEHAAGEQVAELVDERGGIHRGRGHGGDVRAAGRGVGAHGA